MANEQNNNSWLCYMIWAVLGVMLIMVFSFYIIYNNIGCWEKRGQFGDLFGGSTGAENSAYHKISPEEAKQMMEQGNVTIVDVRMSDEYEQAHIKGAILVPLNTIQNQMPEALPDLDAVLLVHCQSGIRSKKACDQLVKLGYKHIYDFGGLMNWPYETQSGVWNE